MMNDQYRMMNGGHRLTSCISTLIFSLALVASLASAAETDRPSITGVRVGLADRYKVGLWTQVEVILQGGSEALSGELSVVVPDGDGVPSRVTTPPDEPCKLAPGGETTVRLLCRPGRVQGTISVEFRVDGQLLAQRTFKTGPQADADHFLSGLEFQKLVVSVGPSALGVEEAGNLGGAEPEYRPATTRLTDLARLPTEWCGYEGVDAVMLSTSKPDIYSQFSADSPQIRALDEWVQMGGRLVLCIGANAEQVLKPDSALARFVPGRLDKMVWLRQTGSLESYCGSRTPIPQANDSSKGMRVPQLSDVHGIIEAHEADLPLVVRVARGFGQIIFIAVDLDRPPIDTWSDRPMLVAKLLDMPTGHAQETESGTAMMHFGYSDISGQLRSALDRFGGVRIAPFWFVAALIVAYLLLIGPGDYFFLRKLVGRMTWTWLTFPTIVALVCLGAYMLAYRLKGDQIKVRQADLVDVDTVSGRLRGTTWLNIFSPATETFDLSVEPQTKEAQTWMAWLGLPGGGLGGMNPRAGEPGLWTEPYRFSPTLTTMSDVPIQVWSTKSLTARWTAPTTESPKAELADDGQLLSGVLTNTLGFPLEQCILAYGRSVYDLGTIRQRESVRLGAMTKRSELKTLLTGRKVVFIETGEKYRQESTPYDQSSTDIPYVLRTMMFYDAAGGRNYTGLWNSYQGFVDLSSLLNADRAILVAQGPSDSEQDPCGAKLLRDGRPVEANDKHVTIYRFVYPVKK